MGTVAPRVLSGADVVVVVTLVFCLVTVVDGTVAPPLTVPLPELLEFEF